LIPGHSEEQKAAVESNPEEANGDLKL